MEINISRFKGIEEKSYALEVVTPLFLGGSNPQKAELRTPPFKAAMRFWWRAIYGSDNIADMKERESQIFGDTENKSKFDIAIIENRLSVPVAKKLAEGNFNIYEYLGYGYRVKKEIREHIDSGTFKISIRYPKQYREEIFLAFQCLVHLGGIGAKSHNGFGNLQSINVKKPDVKAISLLKPLKSFTSFSSESRMIGSFQEQISWQKALAEIGESYKNARFQLKKLNEDRSLIAKPFKNDNSRHAKPYFLHVNKLRNGKFQGQILFMPYNYFDAAKRNEYFRVCEKMNRCIEESSNGGRA